MHAERAVRAAAQGVPMTHHAVATAVESLSWWFGRVGIPLGQGDVYLSFLPLAHIYGRCGRRRWRQLQHRPQLAREQMADSRHGSRGTCWLLFISLRLVLPGRLWCIRLCIDIFGGESNLFGLQQATAGPRHARAITRQACPRPYPYQYMVTGFPRVQPSPSPACPLHPHPWGNAWRY
jgi:hypothetical protein